MRASHPTQLRRFLSKAVRGPLLRVEVVGTSMLPTLSPGDRLLVLRWARARTGALVAVADPREPARMLVKRVQRAGAGGVVELRGDNEAASTDSRTFGPVAATAVTGRVVYRYAPTPAVGRVR